MTEPNERSSSYLQRRGPGRALQQDPDTTDDLRAARGILLGALIGLVMWTVLLLLVFPQ